MGKIQFEMIACVDENWGIGKNGKLLKSIPEDMALFKKLTMGGTVIMGRKTLESLPGKKGLIGRTNIVLTRDKNYAAEGVSVVHSIDELIKHIEKNKLYTGRIFVIGGGEIYRLLLPYCKKAYITMIHDKFDADAFFPGLVSGRKYSEWELTKATGGQAADGTYYEFLEYENTDAVLTEDLIKGARLSGVLGEAAERIKQLKQENLEYRLKTENLAKCVMHRVYPCPFASADAGFKKECGGFSEDECMECIIRHSDML